jgi:acyl-CoA reductase-like NAD-dependent aldehyde dehydrogenase
LLVGGDWVEDSDGTYPIMNPATEEVTGGPEASVVDAEADAAAVRKAQAKWAARPHRDAVHHVAGVSAATHQKEAGR